MNMINPENIVLGSFIGDALSLGSHWVYDHTVIREKSRNLTVYHPPIIHLSSTYHPPIIHLSPPITTYHHLSRG